MCTTADGRGNLEKAIDKIRLSKMARELQESLRASGKDSVNVRAIKAKVRLSAEPKEGSKK